MNRASSKELLLDVKGLKTHFTTDEGTVNAVDGVDLQLMDGRTLCVVGESGCGKSVTARSILQLITKPGRITGGQILFRRPDDTVVDIAALDPRGKEIRSIRGRDISMIFQEPMTSLSPVHTIGSQIMEGILLHTETGRNGARDLAIDALDRVGIPKPESRLDHYPFQLSGGMRQRAMIAMALACRPSLLIADEPTTALDVTTQANILDLISELQEEMGMAVMFITHDLGVVAEIADDVAVMYLGRVVESAPVDDIFHDPQHPYTQALLRSIPRLGTGSKEKLDSIRGMVPHPFNRPSGCDFHPRCDQFLAGKCDVHVPPREDLDRDRTVRCLLHTDLRQLESAEEVKR